MIDCTITGIAQEMDFEQGVTLTYLLIRLPDGTNIRSPVDENSAAAVIKLQVEAKGAPRPAVLAQTHLPSPGAPVAVAPLPPEFTPSPATDDSGLPEPTGDDVHVFGGQDDAPPAIDLAAGSATTKEEAAALAEGSPTVLAEPAPDQQPQKPGRRNVQQLPNGKVVVPSRTVRRNDAGYPMPANAGVDTADIVGGRDQDEDGVGSV